MTNWAWRNMRRWKRLCGISFKIDFTDLGMITLIGKPIGVIIKQLVNTQVACFWILERFFLFENFYAAIFINLYQN